MSKKICYLSGPIEGASDDGAAWRDRITPKLEEMGYEVLNPLSGEDEKLGEELQKWKETGNWEKLVSTYKSFQDRDIDYVHKSELLIVNWNTKIVSFGTCCELWEAWRSGIQVKTVIYGPLTHEKAWMLCLLRRAGKIYPSFTKLLEELKR